MSHDPLTARASSVIKAGRRGLRPKPTDRERIAEALRSRLGPRALPSPTATATATSARGLAWSLVTGAVVGVCVASGALFIEARPAAVVPLTPPELERRALHHAVELAPAPSSAPVEVASVEPPPNPPPLARPASTRSRQDQLAREVALLARATSALSAGRGAEALQALDEHQRDFPNGVLTQERRAAKTQALCSLGRIVEGRAELARLAPRAARRVKRFCDAD